MKCLHCQEEFGLGEALAKSLFSWPEMATIWFECGSCGKGNHIRFQKGGYGQIRMLGAPGPEWEQIVFFPCSSVHVRQDPSFLHVWVGEKHYEVAARE